MANWANPVLTTQYDVFLAECKERDLDALTLCLNEPTGTIPTGAMRYVRASNKFQEYSGTAWADKVIALAGGGTGAATASGARTNLGLGTIATQNSDSVTITGGSITTLAALSLSCSLVLSADGAYHLGAYDKRIGRGYFKDALVIPVGVDKYATV